MPSQQLRKLIFSRMMWLFNLLTLKFKLQLLQILGWSVVHLQQRSCRISFLVSSTSWDQITWTTLKSLQNSSRSRHLVQEGTLKQLMLKRRMMMMSQTLLRVRHLKLLLRRVTNHRIKAFCATLYN